MNLARLFRSPVSTIALGAVALLTGVLHLPPAPGKAETNWTDCGDGWECASIEVPLDYDHPNQSTVQLELSRLPAAGPGPRLGSLLFNFGGPGASTIDILPGIVEFLAPEVRQRFDLVAFDPRGVGHSSPIRCNQNVANFWGLDGTPDDEAEWNELVVEAKVMATNCAANGELLAHMGTVTVARDMDQVRIALGEDRISYVGYSYGTSIGALYADMFPARVRAMVLDGAYNFWSGSGISTIVKQSVGFELALGAFVADCRSRPECQLNELGDPALVVEEVLSSAERSPIPAPGADRPARIGEVVSGVFMGLYAVDYWPDLEKALFDARAGDGTGLVGLTDVFLVRNEDGSYPQDLVVYTAVECLDKKWPNEVDFRAEAGRAALEAPHFGSDNLLKSGLPCAFWPHAPQVPPAPSGRGAPPILVVGTTGDPATPYEQGVELANRLESAHFLTHVGEGHTIYGFGNACIDDTVNAYLIDLNIVTDGARCETGESLPTLPGGPAASPTTAPTATSAPPTNEPPAATPANRSTPTNSAPLPPATGSGATRGVDEHPWPVLAGLLGLGFSTVLIAWWGRSRRAKR